MQTYTLHAGDCMDSLAAYPDNYFHSVVTDPPYGLGKEPEALEMLAAWLDSGHYEHKRAGGFMGKQWDSFVPQPALWREVWRVMRPGAHLLTFGGTRTYDLLTLALRLAGFEIRDCIQWLYGSGFPKSLDVSKAIDKANGRTFEDIYALGRHIRERREASGYSRADVNMWFGYADGCEHWERQDEHGARVPSIADWGILQTRLRLSDEWRELIERTEAEREVIGVRDDKGRVSSFGGGATTPTFETAPATDSAREWSGWGTALKPACEPIVLARKPLEAGNVAANVLKWHAGAINVDASRVEANWNTDPNKRGWQGNNYIGGNPFAGGAHDDAKAIKREAPSGRWPANVILDEEAAAALDEMSGTLTSGGINAGLHARAGRRAGVMGEPVARVQPCDIAPSSGGASRFFYCAKASRRDRDEGLEDFPERITGVKQFNKGMEGKLRSNGTEIREQTPMRNTHPTVKPLSLMRYLLRLITPPGGVTLDPFTGSGSTGKAAMYEGFIFVGMEREPEYVEIARARIEHAIKQAEADRIATQEPLPLAA
jgi:DNA modification methylase